MLLKQLPSIVCAIAATWFAAGVAAQDDDNVKSIPVSFLTASLREHMTMHATF